MIFVYVVVSNGDNFYVESCAISIYSLKKYNKDAKVWVLCDTTTYNNIKYEKKYLIDITDKIIPISIEESYTSLQKSRFLKTSIRRLIDEDFVFIDTDTIITGYLKDLYSFKQHIGAVKAQDSKSWSRENQHIHFKRYNRQRNLQENFNYGIEHYFNSGFIICRNTPEAQEFYDIWHKLWLESSEKYNYPHDQCDFNRTNAILNNIVSEVNGIYNFAAIYPGNSMKFFKDCRIFHYFSSSEKLKTLKIKNSQFLENLKKNWVTPEIDNLIENIKSEYLQHIYKNRNCFFSMGSLSLEKNKYKILLFLKNKIVQLKIHRILNKNSNKEKILLKKD